MANEAAEGAASYGRADAVIELMDAFLLGVVDAAYRRLLPQCGPEWPEVVREVQSCLATPSSLGSLLEGPDARMFTEDLVAWAVHRVVMDRHLESFFYQQQGAPE